MCKRLFAATMLALALVFTASAPLAHADRYTEKLCLTNPAYRSMHEDQCELYGTGGGTSGSGSCGGICGILRSIPIVGGIF